MTRIDGLGFVAVATAISLAGCTSSGTNCTTTILPDAGTYYFITHGSSTNPFWLTVVKGLNDAAARYGVTVVFEGTASGETAANESSQVTAAVAAGAAGIAVTIADVDTERDAINAAVDAGVPVIAVNIPEIPGDGGLQTINYGLYVGQNDLVAGQLDAQHALTIAASVPKRGVCIRADPSAWAEFRCAGVKAALEAAGVAYDEVDLQEYASPMDSPQTDATALSNYFLDAGVANVGYVQLTADATLPILFPSSGAPPVTLPSSTIVGSCDTDTNTFAAITAGQVTFTDDQQPYLQGYLPIQTFVLHRLALLLPVNDILTGPFFIDKSNIGQIQTLVTSGYR